MPTVKALVQVETGSTTAVVGGKSYALGEGDQIYVGQFDDVLVADHALARIIYRGGAVSVLCGGTQVTMGHLDSSHTRPVEPSAALKLNTGQVLMDTRSGSSAFVDLAATLTSAEVEAVNQGPAWYSITPADVEVSEGVVTVNGDDRAGNGESLGCPGTIVSRPSGNNPPEPAPTDSPTASPSPSESPSDSPSPSPSAVGQPEPDPDDHIAHDHPSDDHHRPSRLRSGRGSPSTPTRNGRPDLGADCPTNTACTQGASACSSTSPVVDLSARRHLDDGVVEGPDLLRRPADDDATRASAGPGSVGPIDYPGNPTEQDILNITVTATNAAGGVTQLSGGPVTVLACQAITIG